MFDNHAICKDRKAPSTALIKLGNTVYRLVAIENFFFFLGGRVKSKAYYAMAQDRAKKHEQDNRI